MAVLAARVKMMITSLVIAFVALASVAASAGDLRAEADRIVQQFVVKSGAPGLSVSVGRNGRLVWSTQRRSGHPQSAFGIGPQQPGKCCGRGSFVSDISNVKYGRGQMKWLRRRVGALLRSVW